jgi:hypothetical protein
MSTPLSIMASIDLRNASARPILGSALDASTALVMSLTVTCESTSQCDTKSERRRRRTHARDPTGPDVDAFAQPFPDHPGLQQYRLAIWKAYATYESRHDSCKTKRLKTI